MSPENVLLQPLPAMPQPPPSPALPAASSAGGASPPSSQGAVSGSGSDTGDAPGADPGGATDKGEASGGSSTSGRSGAGPVKGRRGGTAARTGQVGKAGKNSTAGAGSPRQAAPAGTVPGGAPFAQTLALSLAAHDSPGGGATGAAVAGQPATKKSDGVQKSDKDAKTDPVQSALALVLQGLAGAPHGGSSPGVTGAKPGSSAAAGAATAVGAGSTSTAGTATTGAGSAGNEALLAHAGAQDTKILTMLSAATAAAIHGQGQGQLPGQSQSQSAALPSGTAVALAAAQLGLAATAPTTPTHALVSAAATLNAPVGTSAWTEELGTQLTWMTGQGIQSASLQLTPAHLGPLQVSISVHNGQASVWFGAAQGTTRQALERSMPQLQQMFSSQGLTLTDSGVSRDSQRERPPSQPAVRAVSAVQSTATAITAPASVRVGLVDAYV